MSGVVYLAIGLIGLVFGMCSMAAFINPSDKSER